MPFDPPFVKSGGEGGHGLSGLSGFYPYTFVDHLQSQVEGSQAHYKHAATSPPLKAAVLTLFLLPVM